MSFEDVVFTKMRPMTYYRPVDLANEAKLDKKRIYSALKVLAGGMVIDRIVDGRRVVYITRQSVLF